MRGLDTLTHTQYDYRNPRCACAPRVNKALKCKTLGVIHMQVSHAHIHYTSVVYTAHALASASLPRVGFRLYLACFTPVAPVASL